MLIFVLVLSLIMFAWSVIVIIDCCRRRSGIWEQYRAELENRQAKYTVVLVVAALLVGQCLDRMLP